MPRRAEISKPHPVPDTFADRKSRFLFFYFDMGQTVKKRCEKDGVAYLNLEAVARGLGFTRIATSGNEVVRWERVEGYLKELGMPTCGHDDYIPENIFYRLACAACTDANASLMGVQGVRLRFFFQILCGIAGGIASADALVKCAHKGKALLYADFRQGQGSATFFGGFGGLFFLFRRLFWRMFSNNI